MDFDPIILSIPIYFLLIGVELIIQAVSEKKIYRLGDAIANISCGITQQIGGIFFKVATIAVYEVFYQNFALFSIPNTWWSIILLVLGVDFCYYWAHRMSHEVNLFWGGHVVHHQSEDYNFSVALRQGTFQILWTFWFYLPLAILGFETTTFLIITALNTVYQFWIHTETIGKLPRWIELIFNTPSHHRVHHGRDPKYIDKNHAGSLIIWDRLFGTFQKEEERPVYGITKPVNTWNPVWAHFQHYVGMYNQLRSTPGWDNKAKVLFYKPGWRTQEQGGYEAPPPVNREQHHKYDARPQMGLSIYVLVQFVIILGLTAWFLFTQDQYGWIPKIALSAYIVSTLVILGLLLDNKIRWVAAEYARLIFGFGLVVYLGGTGVYLLAALSTLVVASMVILLRVTRSKPATTMVKT